VATPILIATAGAVDANSYATVAEANIYHDARLHSTDWTGATTATKTVALIMATRLLDSLYDWAEYSTSTTQALQWPRSGILDAKRLSTIDSDAIPPELINATAEFARQLIVEDTSADNDIKKQGITGLRAGPVSLQFDDPSSIKRQVIPDAVFNLLPDWWGDIKGRDVFTLELQRA
jgi:hypothetical protein